VINYTLINKVTADCMQANFAVYSIHENVDIFGRVTASKQTLGSAVLFKKIIIQRSNEQITETEYYLLTNNHAVDVAGQYDLVSFKVKDYRGNVFNAKLVCNMAEYDLAVVKFVINDNEYEYNPLYLAQTNPTENVLIIAIGHPQGQANALTVGRVRGYGNPNSSEKTQEVSNVSFEIIYHDAPIDKGSSGGALISEMGEIVGINFAMTATSTDNDSLSCAIPPEKIIEFLTANDITC